MQQQQQLATVNVGPPTAYVPVSQAPAPWVATTHRPTTVTHYRHRQSIHLGVTLIVVGLLSIGFNIVDVCISKHIGTAHEEFTNFYSNYYYGNNYDYTSLGFIGHGFWSGIMCVLAGSFAVGAGHKRTVRQIRTSLLLCIVAACVCLAQLGVALTGAIIVGLSYIGGGDLCCTGSCYYHNFYYDRQSALPAFCREIETLIAMESLLALVSAIGGIAAIWVSAFGCRAVCCSCTSCCCCKEANPAQSVSVHPQMVPNGVPVSITSVQQQGGCSNMVAVLYSIQYPVGASSPPVYQFAAAPVYYPPPTTALVTTQPTQPNDVKSPL